MQDGSLCADGRALDELSVAASAAAGKVVCLESDLKVVAAGRIKTKWELPPRGPVGRRE